MTTSDVFILINCLVFLVLINLSVSAVSTAFGESDTLYLYDLEYVSNTPLGMFIEEIEEEDAGFLKSLFKGTFSYFSSLTDYGSNAKAFFMLLSQYFAVCRHAIILCHSVISLHSPSFVL